MPCCAAAPGRRLPLVLMLHGWGERGAKYAGLEGAPADDDQWTATSEEHCFLVVWPQALTTQLGAYGATAAWNAGGCSTAGAALCDVAAVRREYGGAPLC